MRIARFGVSLRLSAAARRYRLVLPLLPWLLLPVGTGAQARNLVIGTTQFPSTLNPNISTMAAAQYVLGFTQRPFTTFDQRWELVCLLCEELPTLENGRAVREEGPEGKAGVALTYTIRAGATWGDGTPVTTADVVFTWEVGRHPESGISNAELYRRLWKVERADDRTFTLHYVPLGYNYNAIDDFRLLPAHLERPIFTTDPSTYRNRTLFETEPTNPGLWFGPYRIAEAAPGSHITLERNPTFWGEPAAFERVVIRAVENTAALEANLLAGDVDMIEGPLGLPLEQAVNLERRHGDRFRIHYQQGLTFEHLEPMLDQPALGDVRVRRALLMGIDRAAMNERLFGGRQPPADTAVHPLDWVHTDDVQRYGFDPEGAAALLDQAGWRLGAGGLRRNEKGEPLRLGLVTTAGNRSRELLGQVMQSQWKALGVEVSIATEPPRVLFGQTLERRAFGGFALFAWLSSPEHLPRSTLRSSEIPSSDNHWVGQNYAGYRNPEMDRLIDGIEVELDRDRRQALWHELQQLYAADLPALPLFFRTDAHIWPPWLTGVEPTGHMAPTSLWVETWRVAD